MRLRRIPSRDWTIPAGDGRTDRRPLDLRVRMRVFERRVHLQRSGRALDLSPDGARAAPTRHQRHADSRLHAQRRPRGHLPSAGRRLLQTREHHPEGRGAHLHPGHAQVDRRRSRPVRARRRQRRGLPDRQARRRPGGDGAREASPRRAHRARLRAPALPRRPRRQERGGHRRALRPRGARHRATPLWREPLPRARL